MFYVLIAVEKKVYSGVLLNQTLALYYELRDVLNYELLGRSPFHNWNRNDKLRERLEKNPIAITEESQVQKTLPRSLRILTPTYIQSISTFR